MVLDIDASKLTKEQAKDAADRALAVIQNRIDQFGVFEPVIQKIGNDRLLVELPGVDRERAKSLIGQVALLEFHIVADDQKTNDLLKTIDNYLRVVNKEDTTTKEQGKFMDYIVTVGRTEMGVEEADYPVFSQMLRQADTIIPKEWEFVFGAPETYQGRRVRTLYLLKREAELTGSAITDARPSPYQGNDPNLANSWIVSLRFDRKDASKFATITGRNVNKRLAIVLDNVVKSAPVIRERIPSGEAMITTGDPNPDKAKDLAIVLRSGALPAPVTASEERSVGPSLGSDSINKGLLAVAIGSLLVFIFMVLYYSAAGLIADLALVLNIFFLFVVLAGLKASLSLPGIAGIALTIGMAVDANILIFERIREELRAGKRVHAAIDAGYARAAITIFDSNMTTIIATVALYFFGTGAIRGFAVTLIIGLVINIIMAVYFSHFIYGWIITKFPTERLRI
jgi:protein-export membrane protein SecD